MTIAFLDRVHPLLAERLRAAGHDHMDLAGVPRAERDLTMRTAEGLIVRSTPLDEGILRLATGLKFVARAGAGMENIDTAWCERHGVRVYSAPEGNRDGVGEMTVMLLLMLLKNAMSAIGSTQAGGWEREAHRGFELHGRTVGIIGYGNMGSAFAERLHGFGARILAYDKYRNAYAPAGVEESAMEQLRQECDVISLHLPSNPETHTFVDDEFIAGMARPFWLINTARGAIVDTAALVRGLDSGKVLGAGLDVLEQERADLSGLNEEVNSRALKALRSSPRVVITPHVAGVTHEGARKMAGVLADRILHDFPHGVR